MSSSALFQDSPSRFAVVRLTADQRVEVQAVHVTRSLPAANVLWDEGNGPLKPGDFLELDPDRGYGHWIRLGDF